MKDFIRDIGLLWEEFTSSEWGLLVVALGATVFTIGVAVGTKLMQ